MSENDTAQGDIALDPIEDAIEAIGRGEIVIVVDDEDRENEGDLIMAAEFATCLLYTSPSPRDATLSRMPSSA